MNTMQEIIRIAHSYRRDDGDFSYVRSYGGQAANIENELSEFFAEKGIAHNFFIADKDDKKSLMGVNWFEDGRIHSQFFIINWAIGGNYDE